jgi:hypothetical protein
MWDVKLGRGYNVSEESSNTFLPLYQITRRHIQNSIIVVPLLGYKFLQRMILVNNLERTYTCRSWLWTFDNFVWSVFRYMRRNEVSIAGFGNEMTRDPITCSSFYTYECRPLKCWKLACVPSSVDRNIMQTGNVRTTQHCGALALPLVPCKSKKY